MNNQTDKTKIPKSKSSKLVNSYTQAAQSDSTKRSYSQDIQNNQGVATGGEWVAVHH